MGKINQYQFFNEQIKTQFVHMRTLRGREDHTVSVVRHANTGKLFVLRTFKGSAVCCRKLLEIKSPYLPELFEVAEADGQVLVLEEYVQGDSMNEMLSGSCFTEFEAL